MFLRVLELVARVLCLHRLGYLIVKLYLLHRRSCSSVRCAVSSSEFVLGPGWVFPPWAPETGFILTA